ncbi:hypothetical protein L1049_019051 [Liquidambar formosana]|uniref:Uncharacterized protein n=1 Tax=Liquidambar formosana TaxID=63359 RepID=A0AAP0WML5_LIQFO
MATTLTTPNYPINAKLPAFKCVRSRSPVVGLVACLQKTAFAFGRRLYSQLYFFHVAQPFLVNNFNLTGVSGRLFKSTSTAAVSTFTAAVSSFNPSGSEQLQELTRGISSFDAMKG